MRGEKFILQLTTRSFLEVVFEVFQFNVWNKIITDIFNTYFLPFFDELSSWTIDSQCFS